MAVVWRGGWGGSGSGVVRCGVVWCGVVWCGVAVVWCGVVWCGVVAGGNNVCPPWQSKPGFWLTIG